MSEIIGTNEPLNEIMCNNCMHFFPDAEGARCKAFDQIPKGILIGKIKHTTKLPFQNADYTYTPKA